jgi:hypothetical protein
MYGGQNLGYVKNDLPAHSAFQQGEDMLWGGGASCLPSHDSSCAQLFGPYVVRATC